MSPLGDPAIPLGLKVAEIRESVAAFHSRRPASVGQAFADKLDEALAAFQRNKEAGKRITLGVERQNVARIFRHREHRVERDAAAGLQERVEQPFLLLPLADMFGGGAGAFVRPSRQWPALAGQ